jgi:phenylalanyl-tRNA synthetase beta chain
MLVPASWLRDFADFGDAAELVPVLDSLGLVVEGVEHVGAGLDDIVVVKVKEIAPIEGADRIRRVIVDAGGNDLQIVCGAWNFEVGDLVPLAPVGTVLPGGMEIGRRKMKGVSSDGMLCSGKELNLSSDQAGLLVLGSQAVDAQPGTRLTEALGIERDTVFDIAVEANRPDAMCMAGIARDLAARLHLEFRIPEPPEIVVTPGVPDAKVEVPDPDLCPRFTARVLTGITLGPSPALVARRLVLAGMRPLNNIVDASNYVMLELGQPTHPYDLDRVAGATLVARAGRIGEVVTTLDGIERRIGERSIGPGDERRDCVICDGDDVAIGIGGVMGGASTEISPETKNVFLEAAYFLPMAIARTSSRLGLRTEASVRFERGCDPLGIDRSVRRFLEVVGWSAGGPVVAGESIDVRGDVPRPRHVTVRPGRLNKVLGTDLDAEQIASYLDPIGFTADRQNDGTIDVTVPTFRPDATREIDVIEEVARQHGYQSIARSTKRAPQVGGLTTRQHRRRKLRTALAHTGANECWTPSLIQPGDHERTRLPGPEISVVNPLTPDESVLRRSLMPGLLRALAFNLNRRQGAIRLFEVGNVFDVPSDEHLKRSMEHSDPQLPVADEHELCAILLAGPSDDAKSASSAWAVLAEAIGIEGVEIEQTRSADTAADRQWGRGLHPTRSGKLVIRSGESSGAVLGEVGEIDPDVLASFDAAAARRVGWLSVDVGLLLGAAPRKSESIVQVSKYPSSDIDLAFVVSDDVPAQKLEQTLRTAGGEMLERIWLFDVYRGAGLESGERSLAFRLRFCAVDHTLTDVEVAQLRSGCIAAAEKEHGARIRG